MDKPLDLQTKKNLKRKRLVRLFSFGIIIIVAVSLLLAWNKPSVHREHIRTAHVIRGDIEATLSASGTVAPIYEQLISSPSASRVLAILKKPGEKVQRGEAILLLDAGELQLSYDRVAKELTLKTSSHLQQKLMMEKTLRDMHGQLSIKDLRLQYLQSRSTQHQRMFEIGAVSKDQLEQIRLEEHIATIERKELEESISTTKLSLESQLIGVETEVLTLRNELSEYKRQLHQLACKAERPGVVTFVRNEVGASISRGEVVGRIADLTSYRIDASILDNHISLLREGMPVRVRLDERHLSGRIESIYPGVENNTARFTVQLDSSHLPFLRPSQRVDVFPILDRKQNVIKVKKGPFLSGEQSQDVFIVDGETARRVRVTLGVMSFDEVELSEGLDEGNEVIISDMSEFRQSETVSIH